MPTTANFSLEYPDDNSSVDIAGHFETLADDVDEAINTRLALTGGTLTGSLSGTSLSLSSTLSVTGTTTLTGDLSISKASATHTISSSSGTTNVNLDSVAGTYKYLNFRTGTSARWTLGTTATAESGSNAGTDLFIGRSSDGGAYIDAPLTITRSTGAMTLSGDVTVSKTSNLISTITTSSGYALNFIASPPGQLAGTFLRTSGAHRWAIVKTEAAESGSNAGSDLVIKNYNDDGSVIGSPLTITRSTGAVTLTGDLTVSKASPVLSIRTAAIDQAATLEFREGTAQRWSWVKDGAAAEDLTLYRSTDGSAVNGVVQFKRDTGNALFTGDLTISKASATQTISSSSGNTSLLLDAVAGNTAMQYFRTGTSVRWAVGRGGGSESGSNANSNFYISGYSDAGALLGDYLTITRSTGAMTLTGDLTISKASATATLTGTNPLLLLSGTGFSGPIIRLTANSGQPKIIDFQTGGVMRFRLYTDSVAESGSSVGSDFSIARKVDGGSETNALTISRATGKTTLGSVGASAGLELGSSGPRVMSGTGSPEGVVTAPVGSTWRDTNATTGAIKWIKATGTGNTGWVVEYGDTGLRNLVASLENGWTASGVMLRRVGRVVSLYVPSLNAAAASSDTFYTLPVGFRVSGSYTGVPYLAQFYAGGLLQSNYSTGVLYVPSRGVGVHALTNVVTWLAEETWPSSLPGSAA